MRTKGKERWHTKFVCIWHIPVVTPPLLLSGALALPLPLSSGWIFCAPELGGLRIVVGVVAVFHNEKDIHRPRFVVFGWCSIDDGRGKELRYTVRVIIKKMQPSIGKYLPLFGSGRGECEWEDSRGARRCVVNIVSNSAVNGAAGSTEVCRYESLS